MYLTLKPQFWLNILVCGRIFNLHASLVEEHKPGWDLQMIVGRPEIYDLEI